MSRWGLRYKGVEFLSPDEWNAVVDALNDLSDAVFNPIARMFAKSVSLTPNLGGTYSSPVTITPPSGKGWIPLFVKLSWSGTFSSGETVTIKIVFTYSDDTTTVYVKDSSATVDYWLSNSEVASLFKDTAYIKHIDVYAITNTTSTNVNCSAYFYGIEA
jgi:hypothetical protein